jgi:transposase
MLCQTTDHFDCPVESIPISWLPTFKHQTIKLLRDASDQNPEVYLGDHLNFSPMWDQCNLQKENNRLRSDVAYWISMHKKAKSREIVLIQKNKELEAQLKKRERMLFARKTEQGNRKTQKVSSKKINTRKRGQQTGAPGHGRRHHDNLKIVEEIHDLAEDEKYCHRCNKPYDPFPGTEDSELVEVNVKAHIRRVKRKQYKRTCSCTDSPVIITANGPDKLIPKGAYGNSLWIQVLLDKFLSYRPTCRFLESLKLIGLNISQGTITGGLKRLLPLFQPIYQQIITKNQTENHWHADETRWMVFTQTEGKIGYRWYLWVFKSASAVVYILDKSRSSKVPKNHLKYEHKAILSVDRYSAYKAMAKDKDGYIRLAFCWAHMRRDFLNLANDWPKLQDWAMAWVDQISTLFHLNKCRIETENHSLQLAADNALRKTVVQLAEKFKQQLNNKKLHPACQKVLKSLQNHWQGLTIFVDHPQIPMDNNAAERVLRGPVVGRKNFYGSGSLWSGTLAAIMFTIFQTLTIWNINPKTWLEAYLQACAQKRGHPPEDIFPFLPWNIAEDQNFKRTLEAYDTS